MMKLLNTLQPDSNKAGPKKTDNVSNCAARILWRKASIKQSHTSFSGGPPLVLRRRPLPPFPLKLLQSIQ